MEDRTNTDKNGHIFDSLTIDQENAIDLLVQGNSDRQVADTLNLRRQTVCDWRNHNPAFIAELYRRRQDLWGANVDRLRQLAARSIDVLDQDLVITKEYPTEAERRLRQAAAIQILKACALYKDTSRPTPETT
jgi:hypothetical protein